MNLIRTLHLLIVWLLLALTSACNSQTSGTSAAKGSKDASANTSFRSHNLTLVGYNYADFGIGSFEVNGQGGGNIEVSDGEEGASGSVCCGTVYSPMTKAQPVTIKWNPIDDKWCEQTVMLEPPLPPKPENFEVHFYQDGHIQVAVTTSPPKRMYSTARVNLPRKHGNSRHQNTRENVDNSSKFARCRIGYQ